MSKKSEFKFYFLSKPCPDRIIHTVLTITGLFILKTFKYSGIELVEPKKIPDIALELRELKNKDKCLMVYKKHQKFITREQKKWYDEAINIIRLEKLKRISEQ